MPSQHQLPDVAQLKSQAKRLRVDLADKGTRVNHSQALELIAAQYGYRNWNTLHAACGNRVAPFTLSPGQKVSGRYLGQPFTGEVIGVTALNGGTRFRTTIRFDKPVDVVRFDSFSALRQRVTCTLNADGVSAAKTGDGKPHMQLVI